MRVESLKDLYLSGGQSVVRGQALALIVPIKYLVPKPGYQAVQTRDNLLHTAALGAVVFVERPAYLKSGQAGLRV